MPAALVPELYVSELARSLAFYCDLAGFEIRYERRDEAFAYIGLGTAELMLEEPVGRTWLTAALDHPYGRGINLQISVPDAGRLYAVFCDAGATIVNALEEKSYTRRDDTVLVRQFVVADPDGYLLRFAQIISEHTS
ncbi:bleomycin resistance protein [Hyphomonas oceanitis]|uniref:Bleomycin resistance protein n=1 Tax=Hyphomonas oceanitis SCH89 TaxID=1280953 RepID=A0A059G6R8_9PROT|nr:VOC family protein [Hyphomonas oceanitis]KDA02389.1 hypothetical protein HOC_10354 [Hyphomonas oceanitis SCH89]